MANDSRLNVILGAKDEASKVVGGLRGQFEKFKKDAMTGFGLGAGLDGPAEEGQHIIGDEEARLERPAEFFLGAVQFGVAGRFAVSFGGTCPRG